MHDNARQIVDHFLKKVGTIEDPIYLFALEEPLVMASQMLFMKTTYPEAYAADAPWFGHPLARQYLSILEKQVKTEKPINHDFIGNCAQFYIEHLTDQSLQSAP